MLNAVGGAGLTYPTAGGVLTHDVRLVQAQFSCGAATAQLLLSQNPSLTAANVIASNAVYDDQVIWFFRAPATVSFLSGFLNFPLVKGSTLFVNFSAAGTCVLHLEDIAAEPIAT